jgi:hypothetical protein
MRLNIGDELAVVSIVTSSGEEIRPMTQEEIDSHNSEFDEYVNWVLTKKYAEDRATAYPSITDQLDMLWHAMDTGEIPKSTIFYDINKSIKDKYPKE